MNFQLDNYKEEQTDQLKNNNNKLFENIEERLKKIEVLENKTKQIDLDVKAASLDNSKKIEG